MRASLLAGAMNNGVAIDRYVRSMPYSVAVYHCCGGCDMEVMVINVTRSQLVAGCFPTMAALTGCNPRHADIAA